MSELTRLVTPIVLALLMSTAPAARADDCAGRSVSSLAASGGAWVTLRWSATAERWEAGVSSAPGVAEAFAPLPDPEGHDAHAHLVVVSPRTRSHFVVIDSAADHEPERRVRIYDARRRLVVALGLDELMTPAELERVQRSISHVHWLAGADAIGLDADGDTLALTLVSGRTVRIALGAAPRLLP